MKIALFIITIGSLILSVYLTCTRHTRVGRSGNTIVISNGDFYEEIKHSGEITFNEDETAIKSISPGGYLKFRKNNIRLSAENNSRGGITYELYDGGGKVSPEGKGRKIIAETVKELVAFGFGGTDRMKRIYERGGTDALIAEAGNMKNDYFKRLYLEQALKTDSLSQDDMIEAINAMEILSPGHEKAELLKSFSAERLKNPAIFNAWLKAAEGLPGFEKHNMLKRAIEQNLIPGESFDKLLTVAGQLADFEKVNIYKSLVHHYPLTEEHWLHLILAVKTISADFEKSNLLVLMAANMPETANVKPAYMQVARTISADHEYGKAVRAVE